MRPSMSASQDWVFPKCAECGARCGSTAVGCWMCHSPLPGGVARAAASRGIAPRATVFVPTRDHSPTRRFSNSDSIGRDPATERWIKVGLNVALGIVGIGLWILAPGIAVLYLIVVAPAVTAMFVSLDGERRPGDSGRVGDYFDRFFSILLKTVAVLSLLTAAAFCAMFIFCCVMLFGGMRR
jgi:hypothetical protein